jgi:EAL domain-containing protein (putative c-di-GMP-specific phosphodiesterase class I)
VNESNGTEGGASAGEKLKIVVVDDEPLTRLKLKRIGLSIDDFGTGHASLAQLRDLQYDEIKIDCSFVHGARTDALLDGIVQASLLLAKQLKMTTVAEGVETVDDWHMRQRQCERAQGYFIGRPMSVEELPRWQGQWEERLAGCKDRRGLPTGSPSAKQSV